MKNILILGAGISGLSAAWTLHTKYPECRFTLWEATSEIGGSIRTLQERGYQIEQGVDNFITTVPWGLELCRELGLLDDIIRTSNQYRRTFVVRKGKLYPLPDGFLMMAPTRLFPLAITPLLSPWGKIRAGLELFLPRRPISDESMAEFASRRLGREVFQRIVEPLVSGIYAGNADRLSVWATLPRFPEMEVQHRSLILAMKSQLRHARTVRREEVSGARYSFFVSLREGLASLPERIEQRLPKGSVERNRRVVKLEKISTPTETIWRATDQHGRTEQFAAVISALPAHQLGVVAESAAPDLARLFRQIEFSSVVILTAAWRKKQIHHPMNGMGFVVPEIEHSPLIAGSFSSHKYPIRAPEGTTMIRLFAGGTRSPELVDLEETKLQPLLLEQVGKLLHIEGAPELVNLARWHKSMPQYNVGHLDWLKEVHTSLTQYPTFAIAGNALDGVGIPNCIKTAREAVERIAKALFPNHEDSNKK